MFQWMELRVFLSLSRAFRWLDRLFQRYDFILCPYGTAQVLSRRSLPSPRPSSLLPLRPSVLHSSQGTCSPLRRSSLKISPPMPRTLLPMPTALSLWRANSTGTMRFRMQTR
ncbi:hypothetical protein CY34DRAFT_572901 [Suillus luteus UH-Slu-Lm8-n1]|uniref:Uncharacterized protein n=1 Tax=Suillus luteus UH-Slu-Lm8-n1 TaxID=930992 RepID=A0A0D0BG02_9AGAM|nr:hypothetical protein CY34DRAFT_572901 [Suillus luteus UH-Slu-Lm8-n1]